MCAKVQTCVGAITNIELIVSEPVNVGCADLKFALQDMILEAR